MRLFALLLLAVPPAWAEEYPLHYTVELQPATGSALVAVHIEDARLVDEVDFNLDEEVHSEVTANGELVLGKGRAVWTPPDRDAVFKLRATINYERDGGEYDALSTDHWAIFRGDDLIPPAAVTTATGALSRATLEFKLPDGWPSVNTGWPRIGDREFRIDNPTRRFDRPTGWMIAGKLGTRRDRLGDTQLAVSAPRKNGVRRMDLLTFLNFVWPDMEAAFRDMPRKLLIVAAGDPMWRGGLSGPNSLFLHAERPLVSENGTSPLVHELVHMITSIRGKAGHDWIAEGIAEYYSVELMFRAGGLTGARRERTFRKLAEWGAEVESLLKPQSTGATSARAAVLFDELDREIQARADASLDDVARRLMGRKVSLDDLRSAVREVIGCEARTLESPLLRRE